MKKTIKYTDEPIGDIKIIEDFLPSPKDLVLKDENVKVTISLTKESVEFFKSEAKKTSYSISKNDKKSIGYVCSKS